MVTIPKEMPPDRKARIAGFLYLICILAGFCAEALVRNKLVVYDDAALTARNIIASPSLYRLGFFADLISFITGIVIAIIFYDLFKSVSRPLARAAITFAIVSNTVSIAASIFCFAPLHILGGSGYLGTFAPDQLHSLALLSLQLYQFAFVINLGIFSLDCFASGYLIFRSTFLPPFLGILLVVGGICYLTNSVIYFLPPKLLPDLFPWIYLPSLLAEVSLALWLTVAGVNVAKWHAMENARAALPAA
ncbi:MAG TPA: DUF4386 domain-containing protein [Xanthobacteraceae bacterium]|jgi:hypothetical protein